jgi:hypothetical protein
MGLMLSLKGFVAAVLGGLVNYPAAVAGGFLLGILESLGAGLISSGYKDAITFIALFIGNISTTGTEAGPFQSIEAGVLPSMVGQKMADRASGSTT